MDDEDEAPSSALDESITRAGRGTFTRAADTIAAISESPTDVPTAEPLVARLERAMRRFRLQSAHNLLDEAFAAKPAEEVFKEVGRPLLDRLDDPAALRFATSLLESRLLAQARGWERVNGPLVVLAGAPGEEQALGVIALGIALAERHCRITYLGAGTPVAALTETVRHQNAALAVISADQAVVTRADAQRLKRLDCPLIAIGGARAALARATDATALDVDAPTAPARIADMARMASTGQSDDASPSRSRR